MGEDSRTDTLPPVARREGAEPIRALLSVFPTAQGVRLPASGAVIGRDWLAEQGLEDRSVSTKHLKVLRHGVVQVSDLGSRNGSWVRGARLRREDPPTTLTDGAVLRLGRTIFVYRESFVGSLEPAAPLGELVAPWGLRSFREQLAALHARAPAVVLVEGETGTGKELAAAAIARTLRPSRPFGAVNLAAVPETLFESMLFGHAKGAFHGATEARQGIVRAHAGGTLLLDEIGELPSSVQPKLLRLLENQEVQPVGAERTAKVDVLVVAATNQPLATRVAQGTFRRDLEARLRPKIVLPPLRDRVEDIAGIALALLRRVQGDVDMAQVEADAMQRLMLQPWPGNARDLAAVIADARARDGTRGLHVWSVDEVLGVAAAPPREVLTEATVTWALDQCNGVEKQAAELLGVDRAKLRRFRAKAMTGSTEGA